jgi:hypothetical protein
LGCGEVLVEDPDGLSALGRDVDARRVRADARNRVAMADLLLVSVGIGAGGA